MKEQYYIDWINSLDVKDCIFVNKIEDLYQNNTILLNIIAIILNKNVADLLDYNKLNYLNNITIIMENYFNYIYESDDEKYLKENTILLIKFLKSKFNNYFKSNIINNKKSISLIESINNINLSKIKERSKSSKNIRNVPHLINKFNNLSNINNGQLTINNIEKKKEEFIINYLYKLDIINIEQKNSDFLWKQLIPNLKDGYILAKIINLMDNQFKNNLKDITKETFYKVNIYLNWKRIKNFLMTKEYFNSSYLYQKNFFEKNKNIFNLLYDICHYYNIKNNIKNNQFFCTRSSSINHKNDKTIKDIKEIIRLNNISSKEKRINIIHSLNEEYKNNKLEKEMNNAEKNVKIHKTELNRNNNKKISNKLNMKIKYILSFLSSIGINTSQIDFYSKEMKIFKDGILLYKIISQLEPNKNLLPKIDLNPKQAPNAINNHRIIINYLIKYKNNFSIKYTGKEKELYKAKPFYILNFLFEIKHAFKNEIYFLERLNKSYKLNNINHDYIDKSERLSLPLSKKLRNKFIIQDFKKIWA